MVLKTELHITEYERCVYIVHTHVNMTLGCVSFIAACTNKRNVSELFKCAPMRCVFPGLHRALHMCFAYTHIRASYNLQRAYNESDHQVEDRLLCIRLHSNQLTGIRLHIGLFSYKKIMPGYCCSAIHTVKCSLAPLPLSLCLMPR